MKRSLTIGVLGWLTMAALGPGLRAQPSGSGVVTGQGHVDLKKQPQIMRVYVEVLAKGKNLRESLDKLREQKQTARRYFESFGAAPESIKCGDPTIETEKNDARLQHMMMIQAMRMQGPGPGNKNGVKAKEAPSILVACSLGAEFPIKAGSPEEVLLACHALEEKIKAVDPGGTKGLKQASAQDEELAQEQAAVFQNPDDSSKPGEPLFTYVYRVSQEERAKAMAQAFAQARSDAALLAHATGAELGRLAQVADNSSADLPDEESMIMRGGQPYFFDRRTGMVRFYDQGEARHGHEAMSRQPNKVRLHISVSASFDLKKASRN
jgi:hypothetical protein